MRCVDRLHPAKMDLPKSLIASPIAVPNPRVSIYSRYGWTRRIPVRTRAGTRHLAQRAKPDALLALAFIHHIAIGRNVPLDMAVDWLLSLAPTGVIEFPHKDDPMVQVLLSQRPDIFPEYRNDIFAKVLSARARIVKKVDVLPTRTLYWFERN